MLVAFFAAKRVNGKLGGSQFRSISEDVWYGYSAGNFGCVISAIFVAIAISLRADIDLGPSLVLLILVIIFVWFISMVVGLFLYLPCALLGYNIKARKRGEVEMARSQ